MRAYCLYNSIQTFSWCSPNCTYCRFSLTSLSFLYHDLEINSFHVAIPVYHNYFVFSRIKFLAKLFQTFRVLYTLHFLQYKEAIISSYSHPSQSKYIHLHKTPTHQTHPLTSHHDKIHRPTLPPPLHPPRHQHIANPLLPYWTHFYPSGQTSGQPSNRIPPRDHGNVRLSLPLSDRSRLPSPSTLVEVLLT